MTVLQIKEKQRIPQDELEETRLPNVPAFMFSAKLFHSQANNGAAGICSRFFHVPG